MKLVRVKQVSSVLAEAWYVKYPLDAYALGPLRFNRPVTAEEAAEDAANAFGERPTELWTTGHTEEVPEYVYEVDVPEEDRDLYELDPADLPDGTS